MNRKNWNWIRISINYFNNLIYRLNVRFRLLLRFELNCNFVIGRVKLLTTPKKRIVRILNLIPFRESTSASIRFRLTLNLFQERITRIYLFITRYPYGLVYPFRYIQTTVVQVVFLFENQRAFRIIFGSSKNSEAIVRV